MPKPIFELNLVTKDSSQLISGISSYTLNIYNFHYIL